MKHEMKKQHGDISFPMSMYFPFSDCLRINISGVSWSGRNAILFVGDSEALKLSEMCRLQRVVQSERHFLH